MCMFCDELKKQTREAEEQKAYSGLKADDGRHMEYSVFLAGNLFDGRNILYRWNFGEYRLRFCPECGANIARRLRQWKENRDQEPRKKKRRKNTERKTGEAARR